MKNRLTTSDLAMSATFCAIIIVLSQIALPLPFTPVPVTLGTAGVLLNAVSQSLKRALLAQGLYLLMGIVGLPVFHGFRGGAGIIFGPTGGYIVSYMFMALVTGGIFIFLRKNNFVCKSNKAVRMFIYFTAMMPAVIICYVFGCSWFALWQDVPFGAALSLTVLPFVPGDLIKSLICAFAADYIKLQTK